MAFLARHAGHVYQGPEEMPFVVMGLEIRLDPALGIIGIDLDNCLDVTGKPHPEIAQHLQDMLTATMYIERSPSGHGLRAFCPGPLPACFGERVSIKRKLNNGIGLEVYSERRLLTVTGQIWPGCSTLLEPHPLQQACLERLYAMATPAPNPTPKPIIRHVPSTRLDESDSALLAKAFASRNGTIIQEIWNTTATEDHAAGRDASARDVTLVNALAWWVGPDPTRLDTILRTSRRFLDEERLKKWDCPNRIGGLTYGEALCQSACNGLTSFYRDGTWQPKHISTKPPRRGFHRHRKPRTEPVPVSDSEQEDDGPVPPATENTDQKTEADVSGEALRELTPEEMAERKAEIIAVAEEAFATYPGLPVPPPRGVFPQALEDAIDDVAAVFNGGSRGFAFAALLSMLSHGVAARLAVTIMDDKPLAGNLLLLILGATSSGKTDAQNTFFRFFDAADIDADLVYKKEMKKYLKEMEKYKHLPKAEKDQQEPPEKPASPRSEMYKNMTLESLYDALEENCRPDGVSMVTIRGDEADQLYKNLGAYRPSGGADLTSEVIELWNGGKLKKRRVTSTDVSIGHAYLSLSATTQPSTLMQMFTRQDFLRGFCGRHVIVPASRPPIPRRFPRGLKLLPETWETIKTLTGYLQALEPTSDAEREARGTTQIVHPTPAAVKLFADWYDCLAADMWLEGSEFELMMEKCSMNVAKIALLIHVAWQATAGEDVLAPLSATTCTRAIRIARWLVDAERDVWEMMLNQRVRVPAHPVSVMLAETILAHQQEIPRDGFVLNNTLKSWIAAAGQPLDDLQLRSRLQPLGLHATNRHAGRGRIIQASDIQRLQNYCVSSKVATKPSAPPDVKPKTQA